MYFMFGLNTFCEALNNMPRRHGAQADGLLDIICSVVCMYIMEWIWNCLPDWFKELLFDVLLILLMYFGGLAYLYALPQYFQNMMQLFSGQETGDIVVQTAMIIIAPIAFFYTFKYVMDSIYGFLQWIINK